MRTIAIHAVTLGIALAALFLVSWPIVGDAPWEEEIVIPTPITIQQPTECEILLDQVAASQTEIAARRFLEMARMARCL